MAWASGIAIALTPLLVLAFSVLVVVSAGGVLQCWANRLAGPAGASDAAPGSLDADPAAAETLSVTTTIDGEPSTFAGAQLANAAHILLAGRDLAMSARDQTIGVMTAIGESTLTVLDHGDEAGPDSRGLFQQRDNGAWGSYADRMDPHTSATNFFTELLGVTGRDALPPSIAAHTVQGNTDPEHYAKYWDAAVAVVAEISGATAAAAARGASDTAAACGAAAVGSLDTPAAAVSALGWASPGVGPLSDGFGLRLHPTDHVWRNHNGVDLEAGGCGGAIWAAQTGTVVRASADDAGNGTVRIDHGGGVETRYLHMEADGYLVSVGAPVAAGQQIAVTGSSGQSTGCHLHFEVLLDGAQIDPLPFLTQRGVDVAST